MAYKSDVTQVFLCSSLDTNVEKYRIIKHCKALQAEAMSSNSPYLTFTGSDAHTPVRSNNLPKLQSEGHAQPSVEDAQQINAEKKREAEQEADLIYEEQIEEEYAKREGGA